LTNIIQGAIVKREMPREKLTPQEREQIRELYRLGARPTDIARYFGVTDSEVLIVCKDGHKGSTSTFIELLVKVLPYLPHEGPPFPRCLGIKWEGKNPDKEKAGH
jgi:hypothetical protein